VLESLTSLISGRAPEWSWILYSVMFSITVTFFGYLIFKKIEASFAESI
jgi:ABC-type polysaccharide/polyol phosphate export permease